MSDETIDTNSTQIISIKNSETDQVQLFLIMKRWKDQTISLLPLEGLENDSLRWIESFLIRHCNSGKELYEHFLSQWLPCGVNALSYYQPFIVRVFLGIENQDFIVIEGIKNAQLNIIPSDLSRRLTPLCRQNDLIDS